jgi:energy-coupling factor transport system ATP-binding protein
MIDLQGITYTYPGADRPALDHLDLKIAEGEFVLVVGPSGAGKSTFLRCLNGLVPHFYGGQFSGRISVGGRNPLTAEPRGMSDWVGFVLQSPEAQAVADTVEDELAFAMENHNVPPALMRKRIEEVLDQVDIAILRRRRMETLSGGQRQRVAIAAVLTLQPKVLILDEPTSQLDPQAAEEVLTLLQKLNADLGLTILVSEHRLERVVQYADHMLYFPGQGQPPLFGTPDEILREIPLAPPLVSLARRLHWSPLPLTIKAGRTFARDLDLPPGPPVRLEGTGSPTGRIPALAVKNVWFAYNGHDALAGVSCEFKPGQIVALMGRNGSGKTTLLKNMVGLLRPQQGRVEVEGQDTSALKVQAIARKVGYVPQNPDALLFSDTVADEIAFTRRSHGLPAMETDDLLVTLGLSALRSSYPRDLSGGERQRVALAAILAAEPGIVLLDEPTRGLDYAQKKALTGYLRARSREGKTIIMATHDVELVARCADRVIILGEGQIVVDGPTRESMRASMVFSSQISKLFPDQSFLTEDEVLAALSHPGAEHR